jgi:hypothetical protein
VAVASIELQPCAPFERWRREREQAGFDEGQLAGEIALRWDFPEAIADALRACSQPPLDGSIPLAAVVHLAALMTDPAVPPPQKFDHLPVVLLELLKLDVERLRNHVPNPESFSDISML